jgi:hypothetical protein
MSVLPPEQQALWPHLAPAKKLGFTLYGGTAVALRLGHRTSVDFDFFSEKPLDKNAIYDAMPVLKGEVLQESPDTLVVSVAPPGTDDRVKVSFFGGISFGRFGDPELTNDGVLLVASLDDVMATKIKVLFDRIEQKDYDDLAAMIAAGSDVAKGLAIARQMFPQLNPQTALTAMTYHRDVPKLSAQAKRALINAAKSVTVLPAVQRASSSLSA